MPNHPAALLIQGAAARATGEPARAAEILAGITRTQPQWALAFYELGVALFHAGRSDEALQALREAVRLKPEFTQGWLALADALTSTGDSAGADEAYAWHIKTSIRDPRLVAAGAALVENKVPEAEALLRTHLKQFPNDVAALRMLAELAARLRRFKDSETLLVRCLELAPSFTGARHNYAVVLHRQNRPVEALRTSGQAPGRGAPSPGLQQSEGGDSRQDRRVPTVDRDLRAGACRVSRAVQDLDELRTCAENEGTREREHRRVPQEHCTRAHPGGGVLESGEPEDFPFLIR